MRYAAGAGGVVAFGAVLFWALNSINEQGRKRDRRLRAEQDRVDWP
jgi:hypothetical protein